MVTNEVSCGCVVFRDATELEVLVINNIDILKNKDFFGFPKGHTEKGETNKETAVREVKEETNVDVIIKSNKEYVRSHVFERDGVSINKKTIYFIAIAKEPVEIIIQENEVIFCEFVNVKEAIDLLTYDSDKEILKRAIEDFRKIDE